MTRTFCDCCGASGKDTYVGSGPVVFAGRLGGENVKVRVTFSLPGRDEDAPDLCRECVKVLATEAIHLEARP